MLGCRIFVHLNTPVSKTLFPISAALRLQDSLNKKTIIDDIVTSLILAMLKDDIFYPHIKFRLPVVEIDAATHFTSNSPYTPNNIEQEFKRNRLGWPCIRCKAPDFILPA